MEEDTIAAIATPFGSGGIGVIRISGNEASSCAKAILGKIPAERKAEYLAFYDLDGKELDHGISLFFKGPKSLTGEDVLELQGHGGQIILNMLLSEILKIPNVRMAKPGEFMLRAFLNNKTDLVKAEAIADLISAGSEQAARSAARSMEGKFSSLVNDLTERLTELRVRIEAAIDFPEEDGVDFIQEQGIAEKIRLLISDIESIENSAKNGIALTNGLQVVIAGRPNAGKSSLLNALSGRESAIVTDVAGTTRDALRENICVDGVPIKVTDTAGLHDTNDIVESIGVKRAVDELKTADLALLVLDGSLGSESNKSIFNEISTFLPRNIRKAIVINKTDIADCNREEYAFTGASLDETFAVSAKTGIGLDELRSFLKNTAGFSGCSEGTFTARKRHIDAIADAKEKVISALGQIEYASAAELAAEDLRLAQNILGEITGTVTSDDLLGKIFGSFCIGK